MQAQVCVCLKAPLSTSAYCVYVCLQLCVCVSASVTVYIPVCVCVSLSATVSVHLPKYVCVCARPRIVSRTNNLKNNENCVRAADVAATVAASAAVAGTAGRARQCEGAL